MDRKHNSKIVPFAKELRKNMTKEERHLWYDFLRNYPEKFTMQKVLGKYIADFYCAEVNLVIEIDGSQHFCKEGMEKDRIRTEYLKEYGIEVLRIANNEVNYKFEEVCEYIDYNINLRKSVLQSPPSEIRDS